MGQSRRVSDSHDADDALAVLSGWRPIVSNIVRETDAFIGSDFIVDDHSGGPDPV